MAAPRRSHSFPLAMAVLHRRGLREIAIFVAGYLTYFGVRAITQGDFAQATANAWKLIRFEDRAGIAVEREIQDVFLATPELVNAANYVYIYGHWPALILTMTLLFHLRRGHYYRLRNAILLTGAVGLVIFALFPVAPPRLTSMPVVDTITRDSGGYRHVLPPALVNEYAAMPSFHAGWNVLLGIVVFRAARHWLVRSVAVASALAMVVAVVVTANHFVVDVVAGVGIALLGLFVLDMADRRGLRLTLVRHDVRRRAQGRQRRAPAQGRRSPRAAADRS